MTLEQLRAKLAEILKRMEDLNSSTKAADGAIRSFTKDEQDKYAAMEVEVDAVRSAITREEGLEKSRAEVKRGNEPVKPIPNVVVGRQHNHNDAGEYRGFRSRGDQFQAIYRAGLPGNQADPRLGELMRAATGLNEQGGVDSEGNFLVQSDFASEMIRDVYDTGSLARLCRRRTISAASNAYEFITIDETSRADGSRYGGVQAYWRQEAATVAKSKPSWRPGRIILEDLMALCPVTDQLLQDVPALGQEVTQAFTEEMAFKVDSAIVSGDGVGKPLGFLKSDALISVAIESSQQKTVVWQNVSKMRGAATKMCRKRGVWVINDELLPQLEAMYVPLGSANGLPVYQPAGQFGTQDEMLYKRPIVEAEAAEKLGDKGDISFFDPQEYLLIEKGTVDAQTSIHVRFEYGETMFRFTMRVNGMPLWNKSVTPFKATSGAKRSPYITLAARP